MSSFTILPAVLKAAREPLSLRNAENLPAKHGSCIAALQEWHEAFRNFDCLVISLLVVLPHTPICLEEIAMSHLSLVSCS